MPGLTYTIHVLTWEQGKNGYQSASPVANASIQMQQYEANNDDDTFWCILGAMIKDSFEENIIPASSTTETSQETSVPHSKAVYVTQKG